MNNMVTARIGFGAMCAAVCVAGFIVGGCRTQHVSLPREVVAARVLEARPPATNDLDASHTAMVAKLDKASEDDGSLTHIIDIESAHELIRMYGSDSGPVLTVVTADGEVKFARATYNELAHLDPDLFKRLNIMYASSDGETDTTGAYFDASSRDYKWRETATPTFDAPEARLINPVRFESADITPSPFLQ